MVHPIKTIFFGTPEFAAAALRTLAANSRFAVVAVVTQPDRPVGRKNIVTPPPVKNAALELGLAVMQPERLKDQAADEIIALGAELAVVIAYGNLIPPGLLTALPRGFVNIHPSLLPKHRGASPLTAAILEGDRETGVCLMQLDAGMDSGSVIACRQVALNGDETTASLRQTMTPIASAMIDRELVDYLDGKITPVAQDNAQATFCKLIEADTARINWHESAVAIDRLVRAMHGMTPAWTTLDGVMLLIHAVKLAKQWGQPPSPSGKGTAPIEEPGTIVKIKNLPAIVAKDGYIILNEIQIAGGKAMPGQAFLNGHQDFIGKKAE